MTSKQAYNVMNELNCKDLVMKIVKEFNGENYTFAKKVLDTAAFFIQENCYFDVDLAKSHLESED